MINQIDLGEHRQFSTTSLIVKQIWKSGVGRCEHLHNWHTNSNIGFFNVLYLWNFLHISCFCACLGDRISVDFL